MEELIRIVSQKAGISEAQARTAVEMVLGFLKDRVPGPIAGQIDSALKGGGAMPDLTKGLGGMFGKS